MTRKIPEKRIYNIRLYLNSIILFKSFTSDKSPKNEYSYKLVADKWDELNKDCNPNIEIDSIRVETYVLIFGTPWYNDKLDTFEYFLIRKGP